MSLTSKEKEKVEKRKVKPEKKAKAEPKKEKKEEPVKESKVNRELLNNLTVALLSKIAKKQGLLYLRK